MANQTRHQQNKKVNIFPATGKKEKRREKKKKKKGGGRGERRGAMQKMKIANLKK